MHDYDDDNLWQTKRIKRIRKTKDIQLVFFQLLLMTIHKLACFLSELFQ